MLKRILPFVVAIMTMAIVMSFVLAMRPEIRAELGKLRKTEPIELETPVP